MGLPFRDTEAERRAAARTGPPRRAGASRGMPVPRAAGRLGRQLLRTKGGARGLRGEYRVPGGARSWRGPTVSPYPKGEWRGAGATDGSAPGRPGKRGWGRTAWTWAVAD
ncbi:hypothetical protein ADK70_18445 [Streptomyces rimosus subsp. pseudoverticillatus]|nr:hypothetical protein ADK70_18445 [Streptomyces rimosus subsp. pseudoverticillatus]